MNKESIDCRNAGPGQIAKAGDFAFDETRDFIYVWIPGMTGPDAIQIKEDHQAETECGAGTETKTSRR